MNRAPSQRDPWWSQHVQTCGGSYTKVKEPEGYGEKKSKKNSDNNTKPDATTKSKQIHEIQLKCRLLYIMLTDFIKLQHILINLLFMSFAAHFRYI